MKRILSLALCLCMLISAAVQVSARNYTGTSFINDNTYVLGDVNGDGDQNGKDSLAIKATVAGIGAYSCIEDAADFNADGAIDAKDSYLMKTCLSGMTSFDSLEGEYQIYSLTIGGNPISEYSIVLPDIENVEDQNCAFAAEELQTYVEVATGVKLPICIGEADTPHVIRYHQYFVDTPENIEMGLKIENYKYTVTDGDLDIYGSLRGNMYATYEILEDILGFRFVSGKYTFVYKSRTVDISEGCDVFFEPALNCRWTGHTFDDHRENYYYPSRSNGSQSSNTEYYGAFTGQHFMFGHSFAYCWQMGTGEILDESYGPLVDRLNHKYRTGETHDTLKWQPCATNGTDYDIMFPGLVDICRMILLWGNHVFRTYEEYSISGMTFSFEDNNNYCTCRNCRKIAVTQKEGYSGAYLKGLINRAAEDIQEYYPGLKIATILYDHSVPKTVKPHEKLILIYCGPHCNNHALGSGGCGDNKTYLGSSNDICCTPNLKGWGDICRETGTELWFYYYPVTYGMFLIGCPNIMELYYDYYYIFNECGFTGMYYEGGGETYNFETLKAYLSSVMLWDPDMTLEEYIGYMKEYLYIWYGDGYEYIFEYIMLQQEAGDAAECFINNHDRPFDMYSFEYVGDHYEEMRALLVKALDMAERSECIERLELLIVNCDFLGLTTVHRRWYLDGTEETRALYAERYTDMYNYYKNNNITVYGSEVYQLPNTIDLETNPMVQFYTRLSWDWSNGYVPEY